MRCTRAQEWMAAAADGELSPRRRRALDRHLGDCETCPHELATTERLLSAVEALPMECEVSAGLEQATLRRVRLLAAEEAERGAARAWWQGLRLPAFAIATAAAAALAIGITRQGGLPRLDHAAGTPSSPRVAAAPSVPGEEAVADAGRPTTDAVASALPTEPPQELAGRPDLFVDLPILRNLEKLSNFDAIETTTVSDPPDQSTRDRDRTNA